MRHRIQPPFILSLLFAAAVLVPKPSWSQTRTVAGDFVVEPPTLVSLGFEWRITGDDNRNARVDVTYRKKGEQQWRKGLPLLRLQREQVFGRSAARWRRPLLQLCRSQHVCRQPPESRARIRNTNAASFFPIPTA